MTPRAVSYTATPRAIAMRELFVRNIREVLGTRNLLWPADHPTLVIRNGPKYEELEALSGIPDRTLRNLLANGNQISMVGAAQLCEALGVSLDAMCGLAVSYMRPSPPAEGDGATPSPVVTCIHTARHRPDMPVCDRCFSKWRGYQDRLRQLYAASRVASTAEADAREQQRRDNVRQAGQDPDDVRR